jgi:hypothetical protein
MGKAPTEEFLRAIMDEGGAARARTKNSLEVFYPVANSN